MKDIQEMRNANNKRVDYLYIACNDLKYLQQAMKVVTIYSNLVVQLQQVVEKLFKHYLSCNNVNGCYDKILKSHNLSELYDKIVENKDEWDIVDYRMLQRLGRSYFNTRYPGDNFYEATKSEFDKYYAFFETDILLFLSKVYDDVSASLLKDSYKFDSVFKDYAKCKENSKSELEVRDGNINEN